MKSVTIPPRTSSETRLIMFRIVLLSFIMCFNSMACIYFDAFLPEMMVKFGVAQNKSESGKSAAWITAGFCFGRLISASLWGAFVDKYGRKTGLILQLVLVSFCTLMFGFCTSFYAALIVRMMSGLLNGLSVIGKTVSMEICPNEFKSWSISVTNTIWSTGTILGPVFGSVLYNRVFGRSYPMMLSSIVMAIIGLILIPFSLHFFEETLPDRSSHQPLPSDDTNDKESINNSLEESPLPKNISASASASASSLGYLMRIPNVGKLILAFSFNTFLATLFSGLLIFWVSAKYEDGGLDFNYNDISQIFLYFIVPQLILQIILYPLFQTKFGDFTLLTTGHWIYIPMFLCLPFAHNMGNSYGIKKLYIVFWLFIRNMASFMNFSALQRFTNDIILPENRGKVYGLQGTVASSLQIFAPLIGKGILSITMISHFPFPFDYHFVFILLSVMTLFILSRIYKLRFQDNEKMKLIGETGV
jgi:MFS family permease